MQSPFRRSGKDTQFILVFVTHLSLGLFLKLSCPIETSSLYVLYYCDYQIRPCVVLGFRLPPLGTLKCSFFFFFFFVVVFICVWVGKLKLNLCKL